MEQTYQNSITEIAALKEENGVLKNQLKDMQEQLKAQDIATQQTIEETARILSSNKNLARQKMELQ